MKKVFKIDGNLTIRFGEDNIDGIKKWANHDFDEAMKVSIKVECPVFGVALDFPCIAIPN